MEFPCFAAELTRKNLLNLTKYDAILPFWYQISGKLNRKFLVINFDIPFLLRGSIRLQTAAALFTSSQSSHFFPDIFPHSHHSTEHLSYISIKVDPDGQTISSLTPPPSFSIALLCGGALLVRPSHFFPTFKPSHSANCSPNAFLMKGGI